MKSFRFLILLGLLVSTKLLAASAGLSSGNSVPVVNSTSTQPSGFSWRDFYIDVGGGYITSGDFDGGLVDGHLGLQFFQNDCWSHAVEFEIDGIFETATAGIRSKTSGGADTLRTFKTTLDQLFLMGNYRVTIALGDRKTNPLSIYLGGGIGVDFIEREKKNQFFLVGESIPDSVHKRSMSQFAGQVFAGFTLQPIGPGTCPFWARAGMRLLMTKEIPSNYHPAFDGFLIPYSLSTDAVSWIFEGVVGFSF